MTQFTLSFDVGRKGWGNALGTILRPYTTKISGAIVVYSAENEVHVKVCDDVVDELLNALKTTQEEAIRSHLVMLDVEGPELRKSFGTHLYAQQVQALRDDPSRHMPIGAKQRELFWRAPTVEACDA